MGKGRQGLLLLAAGVGAIMAARSAARQKRRYDFRGRNVLITGGSRGLGLVLARHFAQAGADLALTARDPDELVRARADLKDYGVDILTFPCDITDHAQVQSLVDNVRQYYGKIDILVNNAGVIQVGPMETMTLDDYKEEMQVHFWGPLYVTLAVLPEMRQRQSGRIVNISSIGGKISVPHLLPYCASKFALVGLSEGMRSELVKDNVYVTTVCPGLMRTGSHVNAQFKGQNRLEYTLFSLSNAMPFSSIDADAAAAQIVNACRYGDPELVISIPAQIAATFHALFPGATADLFGLYNRFLPGPGGIGEERASGTQSQTALAPSPLTSLSDQAVIPNNEAG